MIDLMVSDWNGTILADTQLAVRSTNHEILAFGGQPLSRKKLINGIYFPINDFLIEQGCDPEALKDPKSAEIFHEFYNAGSSKCRTRSGVRKVLKYNSAHSIESLILSNHLKPEIETQLERLQLVEYFKTVLAHEKATDTSQGNNKVHRFAHYLEETRQDPKNALIIGDAPEDIGIGKEFGMVTVALTDGYYPTSKLRASNPDYLISNVGKLVDILEEQK